jgi:hypothetical protein
MDVLRVGGRHAGRRGEEERGGRVHNLKQMQIPGRDVPRNHPEPGNDLDQDNSDI